MGHKIKRPFRPNCGPFLYEADIRHLVSLHSCDLYVRGKCGEWLYVVWSNRARTNSFALLGGPSLPAREEGLVKRKIPAVELDQVIAIAAMRGVKLVRL